MNPFAKKPFLNFSTAMMRCNNLRYCSNGAKEPISVAVSPDTTNAKLNFNPGCYKELGISAGCLKNFMQYVDIFTRGRQEAYKHGFMKMTDLRNEGMTFIASASYKFPRCFNSLDEKNDLSITNELKIVEDTNFLTSATLKSGGTILCNSHLLWFFVSQTTKRKASLPLWFKECFSQCSENNLEVDVKFAIESKHDGAHENFVKPPMSTFIVTKDDVDHFGHFNHSFHFREIINNILQTFSLSNDYKTGQLHATGLDKIPLLSIDVLYKKEARLDDCLYIQSWLQSDDLDNAVLYSTITKNTGLVTQVKITVDERLSNFRIKAKL